MIYNNENVHVISKYNKIIQKSDYNKKKEILRSNNNKV
jgi:hypothetical protein